MVGVGRKDKICHETHASQRDTELTAHIKQFMLHGSQATQHLKVRDFLKLHMVTMSHLTQLSIVYTMGIINKHVWSPYNF